MIDMKTDVVYQTIALGRLSYCHKAIAQWPCIELHLETLVANQCRSILAPNVITIGMFAGFLQSRAVCTPDTRAVLPRKIILALGIVSDKDRGCFVVPVFDRGALRLMGTAG